MTAKSRIVSIRLAERIDKNKSYAEKVGVSVEMKCKQNGFAIKTRKVFQQNKKGKNYEEVT